MRILIVDDDNDTLFLAKFYFQRRGWQVATADNCSHIMETIAAAKPDVIVMDNSVPDEGGIVTTQKIKSIYNSIPVIFCSANNNIELITEEAGADTYIRKPFDISRLEQMAIHITGEKVF
jgi:two-component system cell cycle response regulator DivK